MLLCLLYVCAHRPACDLADHVDVPFDTFVQVGPNRFEPLPHGRFFVHYGPDPASLFLPASAAGDMQVDSMDEQGDAAPAFGDNLRLPSVNMGQTYEQFDQALGGAGNPGNSYQMKGPIQDATPPSSTAAGGDGSGSRQLELSDMVVLSSHDLTASSPVVVSPDALSNASWHQVRHQCSEFREH